MLTYRNFEIRAEKLIRVPEHLQGYWQPFWRELPDGRWQKSSILGDDEAEAIEGAKRCIDYQYRVEVFEFLNGRTYDPMKDGCIEAFD